MSIIDINNKHQSQFELFPQRASAHQEFNQSPLLLKDLTVSIENIIVLFIIFVMLAVLSFAFGVERGKRLADKIPANSTPAPKQEIAAVPVKPAVNVAVTNVNKVAVPVPVQAQEIKPLPVKAQETQTLEDIEDGYTVQVASFKDKKSADLEASRLRSRGYETLVLAKGKHSIVCVGKFIQIDKAKQYADRLKDRYKDCLVRRF